MVLLIYAYGLNTRRYWTLFLIFLFTVCCFAVNSEVLLMAYIFLASLFLLLLILDYMFDDASFKYDPDYANWARSQVGYY